MLTRLKVSGFKNLVDVDVRFGPFTCVAGANGVGKSNLFDAIHFLSLLADRPLIEAALGVRGGRTAGVQSLFHRAGEHRGDSMSFEAEMIVSRRGRDDLGQEAEASITFLRYSLSLAYRADPGPGPLGSLEILREELRHIPKGQAHKHLLFDHSAGRWRRSAVVGERRAPHFISTDGGGADRIIKLHQDGGSRGRPLRYAAAHLPRTVLSGANAAESPTALLARREMQSWRLLQLEPSSLRKPDEFAAANKLGTDGSHLPATLFRLARCDRDQEADAAASEGTVYRRVADRLAKFLGNVRELRVDRDERRELLTLKITSRDGTVHPAPALSDSSLRFLALAVLEVDPETRGLLCLEEPENGIHPERIPALLDLLRDIATDPKVPVGPENRLRQVIINSHSQAVVKQVPEESLLIAESREMTDGEGRRFPGTCFFCLPGTWREQAPEGVGAVPPGKLLAYVDPHSLELLKRQSASEGPRAGKRRIVEREDLQALLPFPGRSG
ncbi:MAG: AAA family ATPase [bacterium]|nr:AAA family ATPase [bacterium]